MNRIYKVTLATIILVFMSSLLSAQYVYKQGGFGYGGIGINYGQITNLETNLQDYDLVCTYCNTPQLAWNLGGGGYGLFGKRFVLEGTLYGQFYQPTESESTLIKTTGAYAFLNAGFAVVNKDGWLIYPAVGAGFTGHTMKIKNKTDNTLYFGDDKLYSNTQTDFRTMVPMLEVKVGLTKMLKDMGRVGIGLDVGFRFSVAKGDWTNVETGEIVNDIEQSGYDGLFVNLTIGGGKFLMGNGKTPVE